MAIISPLAYTIANGAPVDATPVQANLSQIVQNVNANAAPVAGSASQQFLVATTANPAGAVPLAQAQSQFAGINGSSSQAFNVASGNGGTLAIPLSQIQAQFAALNGNSAQAFSVAAAASGSTQAPQIAQTVGAGAVGYTNQTASRALGLSYTNSTGRPLVVTVMALLPAGAILSANTALLGLSGIYTVASTYNFAGVPNRMMVQMIVPVGAAYQVQVTAGTLTNWYEY